ncbi:NrfD/PsrC family molybdoenzyme membrane anchor subunit [Desulfitobacterium sp.]|uniref:NrfD/PsrC family molybdoenzyme membrane anchor subunit n=1 Tax=Desulfitobacterium sp. TaxID=49981 RepID=UPI002B5822DA|nr:NrfD/PsrC family molybdoenzyme membrane anchor subunit [Desulfitobacterium sp.]HVJ49718.1 NrfD/PsrC family molybdoenzyme membrane anchor subunit [Desulfitobacterium sp.]
MDYVNGMAQLAHSIPFGILVVLDFFLVATSVGLVLISALSLSLGGEKVKGLTKPAAYLALATVIAGPIALLADLGHPLRFLNLFLHFNVRSAMSWGSYILVFYTLAVLIYAWMLTKNPVKAKRWGVISAIFGVALGTYTGMLLVEANSRFLWNSALIPVLFILSGWLSAWALLAVYSHWFAVATRLKGLSLERVFRPTLLSLLIVEIVFVIAQLLVLATNGAQGAAMLGDLFGMHQFTFLWLQLIIGMILPTVMLMVSTKPNTVAFSGVLSLVGVFFLRYNLVTAGQEMPLTGRVFGYAEQEPLMWGAFVLALGVVVLLTIIVPKFMESLAQRISA